MYAFKVYLYFCHLTTEKSWRTEPDKRSCYFRPSRDRTFFA